jgi:hypothetical protein
VLGREIALDLIPHQDDLLADLTSDTIIDVAGLGSGKTFGIVVKTLDLAAKNWPVPGMVVEPTLPMVRKILVPAFKQFLNKHHIPYRYNKNEHILTVRIAGRWCQVQFDSCHDPERLKGPNIAYAIVDEAGICDPGVWTHLPARVRHEDAKVAQFIAVGTPEGFGEFYEWAEGHWDEGDRGVRNVLRAETYDNIFLKDGPEAYIKKRLSHLDASDLDQYVRGLFVAKGSRVYRSFDKILNHDRMKIGNARIHVGADFNFSKMCWVETVDRGQEGCHVFGECIGYDATTDVQLVRLTEHLQDVIKVERGGKPEKGVDQHLMPTIEEVRRRTTIHCDPSAKNRGTRAEGSDVTTLRNAGFEVKCNHDTIPVKDRVMTVNWRFRSDYWGMRALTVDVGNCPHLVNALVKQGRDKNGEPEKKYDADDPDADLSGPPDALGYRVWSRSDWRATTPQGNSLHIGGYR